MNSGPAPSLAEGQREALIDVGSVHHSYTQGLRKVQLLYYQLLTAANLHCTLISLLGRVYWHDHFLNHHNS